MRQPTSLPPSSINAAVQGAERIWIVGGPGAGKTTLARRLADHLGCPCHELDRYFWGPKWTPASDGEFQDRVRRLADGRRWVIDGQYHHAHAILRAEADTVVWLDPPSQVSLLRVVRRSFARLVTRRRLWNGNRETPRSMVSILLWTLTQRNKVRSVNAALLDSMVHEGKRAFIISVPE